MNYGFNETRRSQLLISFTENLTSEINTEIKIFDFQEWGRQKKIYYRN